MLEELTKLLEIQRLDQKIERLDQRLAEIPRGIQAVEADLLKKRTRLDAANVAIAETEKRKRKLEADIEDNRQRAVKLDGQLMGIKTNQEYRAMLTQIQALRDQSSDKETEILLIMEQYDGVQNEKKSAQGEFESFETVARQDIGERQKHAEVLRRDRDEAATRRGELAASIDKKVAAQYEKVRKRWGNTAVVRLNGEICTGCHLSLRPQHASFIREGKQIYTCENCHRILYHKPAEEQEAPQEQASS